MHSDGRHGRFAWPDMPQNAKSISVLHSWPFVAERAPDADNVKVKSNERSSPLTRFFLSQTLLVASDAEWP